MVELIVEMAMAMVAVANVDGQRFAVRLVVRFVRKIFQRRLKLD